MDNALYTGVGHGVIWCMKYIFVPLGVAVVARIIADRLLQPQPENKRKKRFSKNRF